jgi:Holliday junction resolvasome RuvABC endonuclease subunit
MTMIVGCDLSLTATAIVAVPSDLVDGTNIHWDRCHLLNAGYEIKQKSKVSVQIERIRTIAKSVVAFCKQHDATNVFIENYAFGAKFSAPQLGELGGVVKLYLVLNKIEPVPITVQSARKTFLGHVPGKKKGEAKKLVFERMKKLWNVVQTDDHADAFVIANAGLAALGHPAIMFGTTERLL